MRRVLLLLLFSFAAQAQVVEVQRAVVTDFGASEDTDTRTLSTSIPVANSFCRVTNLFFHSGGPSAGDGVSRRNNDDLGLTVLLTGTTEVTLTRDASGTNEDMHLAYECIQFPSTGNDAAFVRMHQEITLADAALTSDTPISGVSDINDAVAILTGVRSGNTSEAGDRGAVTVEVVDSGGAKLRATRGDNGLDVTFSVAVVEFTGSNWSVQQAPNHTPTSADTTQTETISAVTWANSAIFSSFRSAADTIEGLMCAVWPGSTTTTVRYYCGGTVQTVVAYVVSNSNMAVESIDSITGGGGSILWDGDDPDTQDVTVSSSALDDHFVVATGMNTANSAAYSLLAPDYYLTSTTNLQWWLYQTATSGFDVEEWAAQLIDLSGLSYPAGSAVPLIHSHNQRLIEQ